LSLQLYDTVTAASRSHTDLGRDLAVFILAGDGIKKETLAMQLLSSFMKGARVQLIAPCSHNLWPIYINQ
jgi:hypothetical protein